MTGLDFRPPLLRIFIAILLLITKTLAFAPRQKFSAVQAHRRNVFRQGESDGSNDVEKSLPHVVVIGGGWAGFGAAEGLSPLVERGMLRVTLLEASAKGPGGLAAGWVSAKGRPVEAGIHGFWRNYRNIDALVRDRLGLVGSQDPFTAFTPSSLFSKAGLTVIAPELGGFPKLPAPLGTALWPTYGPALSPLDRISAGALALPWLDFDGSDASWRRYDGMTAESLLKPVTTTALYKNFLEPMLLVLPMAPGAEISAAAALSCFSFFALEHQADFDVRWLKGSATALIFNPWRERLEERGVVVLDGQRVDSFEVDTSDPAAVRVTSVDTTAGDTFAADAVISAISISATQNILRSNPSLASLPDFSKVFRLRAVGVVAVRLWLRNRVVVTDRTASNVAGAGLAKGLEDIGFTFYWLEDLQDTLDASEEGSVVEVDFYNAAPIMAWTDERLLETVLEALGNACPQLKPSLADPDEVIDFAVVRVPNAVSHFAPGCYENFPDIRSPSCKNWCSAGDWIDRGGHRSWSQEKALVTGYQAAKETVRGLARDQSLGWDASEACSMVPTAMDVEADEPHVQAGRSLVGGLRQLLAGGLGGLQ